MITFRLKDLVEDRAWIILLGTTLTALLLAPVATVWFCVVHLLSTGNGKTYIQFLLNYRYLSSTKGAFRVLSNCVLARQWDQNGYYEVCGGSPHDEYAWKHLDDTWCILRRHSNQIISPSAFQLSGGIIAAILEELIYRILPWTIIRQLPYGRNLDLVCFGVTTLWFALSHNLNAGRRWSWSSHLRTFYFTFHMGFVHGLYWFSHGTWDAAVVIVAWHIMANTAGSLFHHIFAQTWFKGMFPTQQSLLCAQNAFIRYPNKFDENGYYAPYAHVRNFLMTTYVLPRVYHRSRVIASYSKQQHMLRQKKKLD